MIRDTHCSVNLENGVYGIFTEVDWESTSYKDFNYSITRYGPGPDMLEDCSSTINKYQFIHDAVLSAMNQRKPGGKLTGMTPYKNFEEISKAEYCCNGSDYMLSGIVNRSTDTKFKGTCKFGQS